MEQSFPTGELWRVAQQAQPVVLMLDYDGTLAPFHERRELALPLPEVPGLLASLARLDRTRVAVMSGRPIVELLALLGPLPITMVGEHGWETRAPGGPVFKRPLPEHSRRALQEAASLASSRGWAPLLELKRTSVALHTRALPRARAEDLQAQCAQLWLERTARAGLQLCNFEGGVELRVLGRDKGTAVRDLIAGAPPGATGVYIGDDATDEDAFASLPAGGLGIRVGHDDRPTFAQAFLESPQAVVEFLQRWVQAAQSAQGVGAPRDAGEPRAQESEGTGP